MARCLGGASRCVLGRRVRGHSDLEAKRLKQYAGKEATHVIPSAINSRAHPVDPVGQRVLWLGTADSKPNAEGLIRLFEHLRQRARDGARPLPLTLVGRQPPLYIQQAAAGLDVEMLGFVEDLGTVLDRAGAGVVPVWAGGGLRLKTLVLLDTGLPQCPLVPGSKVSAVKTACTIARQMIWRTCVRSSKTCLTRVCWPGRWGRPGEDLFGAVTHGPVAPTTSSAC